MDEKLQDLLEAKEGVDPLAPDADVENRYLERKKYIRTAHGDLLGNYFYMHCISKCYSRFWNNF